MCEFWDFFSLALLLNHVALAVTSTEKSSKKPTLQPVSKLTRFSGCYSGCGRFDSYMTNFNLTNENCIQYCASQAYAFAVTRDTFCGCTNSLEDLLPVEARIGEEGARNTNKSKCTTSCPGTKDYEKGKDCRGDNCCGGPSAYSAYGSGKIDVATVLVTRIYNILKLMKKLFGDQKSKMRGEHLHVKIVVKKQSDENYRVCEKNSDGVICEEYTKAPSLSPISFTLDTYKREAQHVTPSMIKPLKGYESTIDLTTTDGKLNKTYQVKDKTNTSNNVEAGFDATVSADSLSKQDRQFFKWRQEFKEGFSFTGRYQQNADTMTETETSNTIKVTSDVPKIGKGEIEFFQDYFDITVKWKATILAEGKAELTWLKEKKEIDLKDFLSIEQRRFPAAGTLRFGDRRTISAVIKIQAAETGILSNSTIKDDSKSIQVEPDVEVTNTTDFIDTETVKDDTKEACPKAKFDVVDKCRHRVDISLRHDKQMECESKFDGEEVCSLFCARAGSLFRGKKERYTNILCPSKSHENTTRDTTALKTLLTRSKIQCKDTFVDSTKFKIKSASGGYLFGGENIVVVFEGKGERNWKLTEWNLYPAKKDGYYYVKCSAKGDFLIRTDSDKADEKVKISKSTSEKKMAWRIQRNGGNIEFVSWKGDSLHSAPDTYKVTTKERSGSGMEWKMEEES